MSTTYRIVGAALVVAALAGVGWYRTHRAPDQPEGTTVSTEICEECQLPIAMQDSKEPMPAVPTGSGLACLVEFGSDECQQCKEMARVLTEIEPTLARTADIVRIDTDVFPQAGTEYKLRMIPTQVLVSADGEELWRHEGVLTEEELVTTVTAEVQPTAEPDTTENG